MTSRSCGAEAGLKELLGHELPSPEAARQFLNRFHSQEKLDEAKESRKPEQLAFIPEEGMRWPDWAR